VNEMKRDLKGPNKSSTEDHLANHGFDFKAWTEITAKKIANTENRTDLVQANDLLRKSTTLELYIKEGDDEGRGDLFEECAVISSVNHYWESLFHHGTVGSLALLALLIGAEDDPLTFALFARWAILYNIAQEIRDYITFIIPFLLKKKWGIIVFCFHHIFIWFGIPINIYFIEKPCGTSIVWMIFILAGGASFTTLCSLIKSLLDWKITIERRMAQGFTVLSGVSYLVARNPLYVMIGYDIISKVRAMEGENFAMVAFVVTVLVIFEVFNLLTSMLVLISFKKIFKIRKEDSDKEFVQDIYFKMIRALSNPVYFSELNNAHVHWDMIKSAQALGVFKKTDTKME